MPDTPAHPAAQPSASSKFRSKDELLALTCPENKPFIEAWHVEGNGFGARIMRANKRTGDVLRQYLVRYRNAEGKDVKERLGSFDEITYTDAMREALDRRSVNAYERRTGKRPLPTLKAALDLYLEDRKGEQRPTTVEGYKKKWRHLELFYDENIATLGKDFWLDRYLEISKNSGRPTADAVARIAHAIYENLVADERISSNPVKRVAAKYQIYRHNDPKQVLIKRRDLPTVWAWVHNKAHPASRDWFLMALFTGLRDAVLGNLRWENIDIHSRLMQVPAEERGNKSGRLVWIPLPDWIHENVILPRHKSRAEGNPWLIPSPKKAGAPIGDIRGMLSTLHVETGVHVGPHILRKTFATIAKSATGDQVLVARMLTHTLSAKGNTDAPAVTAGYTLTEGAELQEAFNKTARLILSLCTEEQPSEA